MDVYGLLFPLRKPSLDSRVIAEVQIDSYLGETPIRYEDRLVGLINSFFVDSDGFRAEGYIFDEALIEAWVDEEFSFGVDVDNITLNEKRGDQQWMKARLRAARLTREPAFENTTVYRK